MNAVVFEHVPVAELPEKWRSQLAAAGSATVTVRIEEEAPVVPSSEFVSDAPAFGIWRDRNDMDDVAAHVRRLRRPRYDRGGTRDDA